jgi:hypothetical protein
MATRRAQAVASVPGQSELIPGLCDGFALRETTPKPKNKIATIAYESWLARAFRNGSPQATKCVSFSAFEAPFGWLGSGPGAYG